MTSIELKRLRKKHKLSQTELAAKIGVTTQAVYWWENGRSPISKTAELAINCVLYHGGCVFSKVRGR